MLDVMFQRIQWFLLLAIVSQLSFCCCSANHWQTWIANPSVRKWETWQGKWCRLVWTNLTCHDKWEEINLESSININLWDTLSNLALENPCHREVYSREKNPRRICPFSRLTPGVSPNHQTFHVGTAGIGLVGSSASVWLLAKCCCRRAW